MEKRRLRELLKGIKNGRLDIDDAIEAISHLPYEDIGFARVDHHRTLTHGIPEVIFAQGKEIEEIREIVSVMVRSMKRVLITRAVEEVYKGTEDIFMKHGIRVEYHRRSGVLMAGAKRRAAGKVLVVCAGTSDIPVAEEASLTARFLGSNVENIFDVGIAGLHRVVEVKKRLRYSRVIIVVAGMEGALPSVIGGMTDRPVIAVPTSVGYGGNLGGITPLFAMLNSCVPGIGVMNIDNGFGAGVLAHKINTLKG